MRSRAVELAVADDATSTKYYLEDRAAGRPWKTRLPFPTHVIDRVEVCDHVTGHTFVQRYRYRHGYFDGPEREFRGFGMVEVEDTESWADYNAPSCSPPAIKSSTRNCTAPRSAPAPGSHRRESGEADGREVAGEWPRGDPVHEA